MEILWIEWFSVLDLLQNDLSAGCSRELDEIRFTMSWKLFQTVDENMGLLSTISSSICIKIIKSLKFQNIYKYPKLSIQDFKVSSYFRWILKLEGREKILFYSWSQRHYGTEGEAGQVKLGSARQAIGTYISVYVFKRLVFQSDTTLIFWPT